MPEQSMSRRSFLKVAGLGLAATCVTCTGLGYAASLTPAAETPELTLGKDAPMNKSVLVTYATRAGSTAEIAEVLAKTLGERGYRVDLKPAKEKPSLSGYQAVLIGSAIRMGSWLPEAQEFVKSNQAALQKLPVALFTVHMQNTGDDEASTTARLAYLDPLRPLLPGAEEAFFAGKMDFSKISFMDRMVAKMVKAVERDDRDWNKIKGWAPVGLVG